MEKRFKALTQRRAEANHYPRESAMGGQRDAGALPGAALITGAAKGTGRRIAERLAERGYYAVLHASPRSLGSAEAAAAEIAARGGKACALACDLRDLAALPKLVTLAAARVGPLTLLVNNAAIFEADDAAAFEVSRFDAHLTVNLKAPLILARDFASQVPAGFEASIINLIDQRAFRPTPQFFTYSLSKSALFAATKTMAQAFAPLVIRVNAVGPGPVSPNEAQGEAGFARETHGVPLARAVSPDDIAEAVLYLAAARNVTGQMIAVDAGQHLAWKTPDVVL